MCACVCACVCVCVCACVCGGGLGVISMLSKREDGGDRRQMKIFLFKTHNQRWVIRDGRALSTEPITATY